MTSHLSEPRYRVFVKGFRFLSFVKNMGKNVDKTASKNFSIKYNQKNFNNMIQSATDALKFTSNKSNSETSRSN